MSKFYNLGSLGTTCSSNGTELPWKAALTYPFTAGGINFVEIGGGAG